jgi:hypothetical protein
MEVVNKYLCEFVVKKQIEDKVTEKKIDEGKEVEVTKSIKKAKPVKVKLIKPTRKLREGAETFYAKTLSQLMKEGLLSLHMIAKRYDNDGGALNDDEKKTIELLDVKRKDLNRQLLESAAITPKTPEQEKKQNDTLLQLQETQQQIDSIQSPYYSIFNQTAEVKARNKAVFWWTLHLGVIENEKGEFVPIFTGDSYEQKLDSYDKAEENGDAFLNEVMRKLAYFVSYWSTTGSLSQNDVKNLEDLYSNEFDDYVVVEEPV